MKKITKDIMPQKCLKKAKIHPKNKMMKLRKTFFKKTSSHLLVDCWFAEYCRYMNCICQNYNVFYCIMNIYFFYDS